MAYPGSIALVKDHSDLDVVVGGHIESIVADLCGDAECAAVSDNLSEVT